MCHPAIGIVDPESTNSRSTGREHGQAAPRMIVTARSLASRCAGAGRVSQDNRPPQKRHGQTMPRTSGESLPGNKNGRTTSVNRGGLQPPKHEGGGRISGTQETHACPPLVSKRLGSELRAGEDMLAMTATAR